MSAIITGVVNLTFGLLWNKFRDIAAKKLDEGDFVDAKCRELFMREVDDIKAKLDGLARKDLLSSVNFLEEGLDCLNRFLGKLTNDDEITLAIEKREDISSQTKSSTMNVAGFSRQSEDSILNDAWLLIYLQAISEVNFASQKSAFESTKECFKNSNISATQAFSNANLDIEDKIMSTKLRVISKILESLDNPDDVAVCKVYLAQLHRMSAIQDIFSVQMSCGGFRAQFYRPKRIENVMSVTMMNVVVYHFIKRFAKMPVDLFSWPSIKLSDKRTYNPIIVSGEILTNVEESGLQAPNKFLITEKYKSQVRFEQQISCLNNKGELIGKKHSNNKDIFKITAGEVQSFFRLPQEDGLVIVSLAIDGEDNMYVVTRRELIDTNVTCHYKLFVFDANGHEKDKEDKHPYALDFLDGTKVWPKIAITNNKKIVIHKKGLGDVHIYVCDRRGQLHRILLLEESSWEVQLSISEKNEIIAAAGNRLIYIYTEEGTLTRKFKIDVGHTVWGMAFNHVTKEIMVHTRCLKDIGVNGKTFYLLNYSTTGGKGQTTQLPFREGSLISHPSGRVAIFTTIYLVRNQCVLYIQ